MNLDHLRAANLARLPQYRDKQGRLSHAAQLTDDGWTLSDWMCALAGEVGEAANIIKKINRGDFTLDEARLPLANELADVLCYLDLLAAKAGIDLSDATVAKFNAVSERVGSDVRLTPMGHYHVAARWSNAGDGEIIESRR